MKGKWGALLVDGRGKVGGHVLTKNRQGAAMRTKVTPSNPQSTAQVLARNSLSAFSQGWRDLTPAERLSWESASQDVNRQNIFGDSYNPTGKNLYTLTNINLALAGSAAVTEPPAFEAASNLTALALASNTTAAQTVSFAPTPVPADNILIIEATRPLSAGTTVPGKQFRKVTTVAAAATSPANTFAAYVAKFGTPITGKKIFIRAYTINLNSGQRSLPLQASSITS